MNGPQPPQNVFPRPLHDLATLLARLARWVCLLWLAVLPVAQASDIDLHQRAKALASNSEWHQLLHYYPSGRSSTGIESHVDDDRFFLATDGKTKATAELLASVDALLLDGSEITNQETDARCRFIARTEWLRTQLSLPAVAPPAACLLFHDWYNKFSPHSITLVFPASFLNSPSSMFGHTLLRIDPENIDNNSPWLSWSLNFAAEVGADNAMSAGYAFRGIAGGYPGKFHAVPYFKKLQDYGAIENRDIWEYKLDLTPSEVQRLSRHAWELNDINFDYFFFRQNCSYRLMELIDWARPGLTLTDDFPLTTIPADTVKSVVRADIVDNVHYRPSLGTQLQQAIDALPRSSRIWLDRLEANPARADSKDFQALDPLLQADLLRAANELLTYRTRRKSKNAATAERRLDMLKRVRLLPQATTESVPRPAPPESGHDTRLLSLGVGRTGDVRYTDIGFRISYHDMLDRQNGYLNGAGISLGELHARQDEMGNTRIQSFEVVKLQSYSDRHKQLNSLSWEVSFGLNRDSLLEDNRLSGQLAGAVGRSLPLQFGGTGFAMLGTSVNQFVDDAETYINGHARLGWLNYHPGGALRLQLVADALQNSPARLSAIADANFNLAKNHALRLSLSREQIQDNADNSVSLAYRFFF